MFPQKLYSLEKFRATQLYFCFVHADEQKVRNSGIHTVPFSSKQTDFKNILQLSMEDVGTFEYDSHESPENLGFE